MYVTYFIHTVHGGDHTSNIWISRLDCCPVHYLEWRGLPFTSVNTCLKFWDSPENLFESYGDNLVESYVKTYLWNFCSCRYFKSELLRACCMARCVRVHVTWLVCKFDTFHPYPWQNHIHVYIYIFIYRYICIYMHMYIFIHFIHIRDKIHSYTLDMTSLYTWYLLSISLAESILYTWHDSFIYVTIPSISMTWSIHIHST